MSLSLGFKLTAAGIAAMINQANNGLDLALTHVQLGSGQRAVVGNETALLTPQQIQVITDGMRVASNQIRLACVFGGLTGFTIGEIGLWAGDPALAGSTLVGYWSRTTPALAVKSPGVDFIFETDFVLNGTAADGNLTVIVGQGQSAQIAMVDNRVAAAVRKTRGLLYFHSGF